MNSSIPKKSCLLAIQGTIQFVTGYISLLWYEKEILKYDTEAVLLIYDTFTPKENEILLTDAIKNLAVIRNWKSIIFIDAEEMRLISLNQYATCIKKLQNKIGEFYFDNVFVQRDFGSFGTELILNAYSKSVRIEYGDSFGLVGNQSDTKIYFDDIWRSPLMYSKVFLKRIIFGYSPKRYNFNFSILSMPIDWSGEYLKDKQLIIPDMVFVKNIVFDLSKKLKDLASYCKVLISSISKDSQLYLLSNFANSGFSSPENEFRLYEDIIIGTAKKGSTVFIKNHPRGSNAILDLLYNKLNKDYDVRIISDTSLSMYPIELWTLLVEKCRVYPIFSSCVISLAYFHNKKVVMPLNRKKIEKYIYKSKIADTLQSELMCSEAIAKLSDWDGKSPLWVKK